MDGKTLQRHPLQSNIQTKAETLSKSRICLNNPSYPSHHNQRGYFNILPVAPFETNQNLELKTQRFRYPKTSSARSCISKSNLPSNPPIHEPDPPTPQVQTSVRQTPHLYQLHQPPRSQRSPRSPQFLSLRLLQSLCLPQLVRLLQLVRLPQWLRLPRLLCLPHKYLSKHLDSLSSLLLCIPKSSLMTNPMLSQINSPVKLRICKSSLTANPTLSLLRTLSPPSCQVHLKPSTQLLLSTKSWPDHDFLHHITLKDETITSVNPALYSYTTSTNSCYNESGFKGLLIVLASGSITIASTSTEYDLWHAFKDGTNNFGILTCFTVRNFLSARI